MQINKLNSVYFCMLYKKYALNTEINNDSGSTKQLNINVLNIGSFHYDECNVHFLL